MNSNYGKSTNFDFDLGLGSNRPRSLNDQKNQTSSHASSSSSFSSTQQSRPNTSSSSSRQPRPSWTSQPAPTQPARPGLPGGSSSMVGDIFGKTWASPAPSSSTTTATSSVGIVNKNPNLFGDLVSSALGQNKGGSNNVPLKNSTPVTAPGTNKGAYSMGNLVDTLPKTGTGNWESSESFGAFRSSSYSSNNNSNLNNMKSVNLGGPSMRGSGGSGGGGGAGLGSNKDLFGSLFDFESKTAGKGNNKSTGGDDAFGDFLNASQSSIPEFTSNHFPANSSSNFMGSNPGSYSELDDFSIPTPPQNQTPAQASGIDVFDTLFSSSSASAGNATKGSEGLGSQEFSGGDDWGLGSEFGGNDTAGTTEHEGLPPPPASVSSSGAKNKGMDYYKKGQYPDAIKWLSWAVILLEKAADAAATMEVLSSRASCYKEVGEYKKAVADCTKVLEHDGENVAVLVQRALLYESMEKYKLGAEDLRTVMKLDPANRVARSTIHRLTQMAG